jgi:hypothetical protein
MTMQTFTQRYGTAAAATSRAREASQFGLMANGSWSIRCGFVVPTTDHKHERPRRPTVIPT